MECLLGVDIGTSTVKCVLVNYETLNILQESSHALGELAHSQVVGGNERTVAGIQSTLEECLQDLDPLLLSCVRGVGMCGQMHGCVLWNSHGDTPPSNLITWQDKRCDAEFISSLPLQSGTNQPVSSGYGCATLAWLSRYCPEVLSDYDSAGTVMDYLVWELVGGVVTISDQNAVSWGYFDHTKMCWDIELLSECGFPVRLLPRVIGAPSLAGRLMRSWYGVPCGACVGVACGDLQCSILAADPTHKDLVLNVGTAAQLVSFSPSTLTSLPQSLLEVPYFTSQKLLVAASLSGGNVGQVFVSTLGSWLRELGLPVPKQEELYAKLIAVAEQDLAAVRGNFTSGLNVDVRLWGERHAPLVRGGVSNVSENGLSLGGVVNAMFRGIVENLHSMMSSEVLQQLQAERVLGSGSALERNTVLQKHVEEVFELPLTTRPGVDAPLGAVRAVKMLLVI